MKLEEAARRVQNFEDGSLTKKLSNLEHIFKGMGAIQAKELCATNKLDANLLSASFELKKLAGQINVVIHAAGILASLPSLLIEGEKIEYLSLGAGNTGKQFDLETTHRIAEFKFINWKGGSESIRQNSLFKDFFGLAEEETEKDKYLYVLGIEKPLKFFNGKRKLSSVMSKNIALQSKFISIYALRFSIVNEYYKFRENNVKLVDIAPVLPELIEII
ncbi:MAG: hypothetical protein ABIJ52_15020 [Pseudomonadota bacterium]